MSLAHRFTPIFVFLLALSAQGAGPLNRPIDAQKYKIDWEVNPALDPTTFRAETTATFKALSALQSFTLDTDKLKIESVHLEGAKKELTFAAKPELVEIQLGKTIPAGGRFTVRIKYEGQIGTSHEGLFKVTDPDEAARGPLLFTQFESRSARSFFPSNDEPYDKAMTEVVTRVPEKYEVVSNGVRAKDRFLKKGAERWREIRYSMTQPHSTYLVAVGVAPLTKLSEKLGKKEISFWVAQKKTDAARFGLKATKHLVSFYDKYLGVAYPWPKYDTVGIPTFLWGGMENTSATFMNQERVLLNDPNSEFEKNGVVGLAAHELAHQWFGDYVTMAWWDDIWLNESFASYLGTLGEKDFFQSIEPELNVVVSSWDNYFREEDGPRSHPIVNKQMGDPDEAFDTINYTKGENVLRMLHHYIGDASFRKGLTAYLKKHAYANATYLDFFARMEAASGQSLAAFRDSWLLQRGYPIVRYGGEWNATTSSYRLLIRQQANHPEDKTTFHFKLPVVFHRQSTPAYTKAMDIVMGETEKEETVKLLAEPEWVTVNSGAVVLGRIMQEKRDEGALAAQALRDPDPFTRTWAAYELADGLLQGQKISSLAERTLVSALEQDTSPYVRTAILEALQRAKVRWLPDTLGGGLFALAKSASQRGYPQAAAFASDPHGWSEWKSHLLTTLGKVNQEGVLPFLAGVLGKRDLSLDDLKSASRGLAMIGKPESASVLKTALQLHGDRGYRYRYWVQYAFGYFESPKAVDEIREVAKTAGTDLMGRIGWAVEYNQTLKTSSEWAAFLQEFILSDTRFGETVKSRLLGSIEDVKTSDVRKFLEAVVAKSTSTRLKEAAKKVLEKNFPGTAQAESSQAAGLISRSAAG
jgi:aminopeptidase N